MTSKANTAVWEKSKLKQDKAVDVPTALAASGLDWEVEKVPVFIAGQDPRSRVVVPGRFGVRRTDTGAPLGVVGSTWEPYQNVDGFGIVDEIIGMATDTPVKISGAGDLGGGRKVWLMADVDESLFIAGEEYGSHLFFTNGHDGRTSVTCGLVTVRLNCTNQLNYLTGKGLQRVIRIRHTVNAKQRMSAAATILRMRNKRNEELAKQGEWLVSQEMPDAEFDKFLESLMPVKDDEGTPAHTMVTKRREAVKVIHAQADNLEKIRNTRWGALQAVIEYSDHGRKFKDDETQMKAQMGMTSVALQQRAYDLLAA